MFRINKESEKERKSNEFTYVPKGKRRSTKKRKSMKASLSSFKKSKSFKCNNKWSFDIKEIDDSGYEALQLMADNFLMEIKVIKDHLQDFTHPITDFVNLFNQKFSQYYLEYLNLDINANGKGLAFFSR